MVENVQNKDRTATQTPKGYEFKLLLQEILTIVSLPEELIRCVFAVALSIKLNLSPLLWFMLVGVPSSAKTDIVSLLRPLDFVYFLDSMTLNPFASGYKATGKGKTYDLLPELDGKCFVCKDYTTIFSLNEETTKKLLGELVSIYDGEFSKFSPTRGRIQYTSIFSHIGCITPAALNQHQRYLNIVGPRFILYRIPALDDMRKKKGFDIAWSPTNRKIALKQIAEKVKVFFEELLAGQLANFEITDKKVKEKLENMSLLMARSRGIVILQKSSFTDENGKEVTYFDVIDKQIEEPWRSLGQLKGLAVSLAILDGRNEVSEGDLDILQHIVNSSMPAERAEALEYFMDHSDVTAKDMSDVVGKSVRTCQRLLKELESLGIIISDTEWKIAKHYNLNDEFKIIRRESAKTDTPSEFMSRFPQTKEVKDFSDDDLISKLAYIKSYLAQHTSLADEVKNQYLTKSKEIEAEGKKRKIFPEDQFSTENQLLVKDILGESELKI